MNEAEHIASIIASIPTMGLRQLNNAFYNNAPGTTMLLLRPNRIAIHRAAWAEKVRRVSK